MKNKILTTCLALACSAALLCAQSAQSNASGTQTQTDRSMQTDKTRTENRSTAKGSIKVTGCLAAGTEPNTFMLNNVSESGSQTSSNTSRSQSQANPSSTPSEMARTDSSYVLVASNKKIDLSKHIGQRVEVTGTLASEKSTGMHSSQSSRSTGSSSSSSSAGMSSDMPGHQLKVRSVRQIAATCP